MCLEWILRALDYDVCGRAARLDSEEGTELGLCKLGLVFQKGIREFFQCVASLALHIMDAAMIRSI